MSSLLPRAHRLSMPPTTFSKPSAAAAPPKHVFSSTLLLRSTVQRQLSSCSSRTTAGRSLSLLRDRRMSLFEMAAASSDWAGSGKSSLEDGLSYAQKMFDGLPQPVKMFPWSRVLWSFLNLVSDLVLSVLKFLSLPVFAITSLSEMSYCANERRMRLIPIPLVIGFTLAGVLRDAAVEFTTDIKEGDFPWHLLAIASFFLLLKLPGPYYPYWGRLLIPHFANGGLLRTLWFTFLWFRRTSSVRDMSTESP